MLELKYGIRVNVMSPGNTKIPLWTDRLEKMTMLDTSKDKWVTTEEVVDVMVNLIVGEKNVGGTVLEVGKGKVREVPLFGNTPPRAEDMRLVPWRALLRMFFGGLRVGSCMELKDDTK